MNCSICVATYKRPDLLKLLLNSLVEQDFDGEIKLEVIVVDNDILESARKIIEDYSDNNRICIRYYSEPLKNIAVVRNKSVNNATGDYIFFIDDDEIASPSWVRLLLETMTKYKADAVFGRILPYFNESTPEWIKKSYVFNRPPFLTGTPTLYTRTGNCLIKASVINQIDGPFDPAYGITGGEDTNLFGLLKSKGFKFVNCYEAWVSEFQPPSRTRTGYILKRALFTGNLYTRRKIKHSKDFYLIKRIKYMLKALVFLFLAFLLTLILFPSRQYRVHWTSKICSNLGHILAVFNVKINAYK